MYLNCGRFFLAAALLIAVSQAIDIKTIPPLETIKTSASQLPFDVKCVGDVPVTWTIPNSSFSRLPMKKDSSIKILNKTLNNTYTSILLWEKATYLDTGTYVCEPIYEVDKQYSKHVFIFFEDDNHLLMPASEILQEFTQEEFGNVTIPCRSTSTFVRVLLFRNNKLLIRNISHEGMKDFKFNPRTGFLFEEVTGSSSGLYLCLAVYKNTTNSAVYKLTVLPSVKKVVIKSNNRHSDIKISGQNISLNCSVNMNPNVPFTLNWIVPNKLKLKDGHVQVSKVKYLNSFKNEVERSIGSRLLNIQNITVGDEGFYVCELVMNSERISHATYVLRVNTPSKMNTYLSLSVRGGSNEIVTRAGTLELQVIIDVSANPVPIFTWEGPSGAELGSFPEKISFMSNRTTSKLIIKDIELFDSGVYKLIANNDHFEEQISVTVLVESKPIIKEINYSDEHKEKYATYHYSCDIFGYPLPDFRWVFKGCINSVDCRESDMEVKNIGSKVSVFRKIVHNVHMYISFNVNESGILICEASNIFGNTNTTLPILVK